MDPISNVAAPLPNEPSAAVDDAASFADATAMLEENVLTGITELLLNKKIMEFLQEAREE